MCPLQQAPALHRKTNLVFHLGTRLLVEYRVDGVSISASAISHCFIVYLLSDRGRICKR
jgi:hypothetical protein